MNDFQTRRRQWLALAAGLALGASGAVRAFNPELAHDAVGPEDGRPVILLYDQDGGNVDQLAAILAAKGIRVFIPSLRAHGAETTAKDMIAFLDAQHMPEAVFAGIGLGARIANAFVAIKPTRCVGLVVAEKLPESPHAFASAIDALVRSAKWRT